MKKLFDGTSKYPSIESMRNQATGDKVLSIARSRRRRLADAAGAVLRMKLANATLPSALQTITLSQAATQSVANVTLPSALQTITLGHEHKWSLVNMT